MTEPSELRGGAISRKEAIEALEVVARGAEATAKMAEIVSDADMARMMNHTKSVVTATIELLSALPSVPEPPNDAKTLNEMMAEVVAFEHSKGWQPNDNRFLESLALLHSEISEALEAYRDKDWGSVRESDGKPEGVTSELADTFIRLLSTWAQFLTPLGHDLEEQYERKMAYNRTRPYRHGGRTI
jgi:NTP pyrophosphatase (non-canonical NTP hydrolase)